MDDWQLHHEEVPTYASHLMQFFWWNIISPRWLSSPKAQIWYATTSGFSQNWNYLWKGRYFRLSMKFRKISWWGSWWKLGELCEVPKCLLWRRLRHHCPMYSVSCIFFNKCLYFSYYMDDIFWTDLIYLSLPTTPALFKNLLQARHFF